MPNPAGVTEIDRFVDRFVLALRDDNAGVLRGDARAIKARTFVRVLNIHPTARR
jgi:hypothetical protein